MKNFFFLTKLQYIAMIWLTFTGCTLTSKEPQHQPVSGRALEYGTLKPIEGAMVSLYKCEGEFLGTFSCRRIDSLLSDSDGHYAFTQTGFLVNAHKAGYFTDNTTEKNVAFGTEDMTDIVLPPHAWLKVTLKNESGAYQITGPGFDATSNGRLFLLPQGVDSTFMVFRKGNKNFKYIFSVIPIEGGPSTTDINAFQISSNGQVIIPSLVNSAAPWFDIYLSGHDTTNVAIIY